MFSVFAETAPVAGANAQQAATAAGPMEMIVSFLPMILLIVVFYFILIRPQKKREKQTKEMLANLKVGDSITTIGGIVGTICKIKDDKVMIETGSKTEPTVITFERRAIASAVKQITAD